MCFYSTTPFVAFLATSLAFGHFVLPLYLTSRPRQEMTEQPEIQTRPVIDKDDAICLTEVPFLGVLTCNQTNDFLGICGFWERFPSRLEVNLWTSDGLKTPEARKAQVLWPFAKLQFKGTCCVFGCGGLFWETVPGVKCNEIGSGNW